MTDDVRTVYPPVEWLDTVDSTNEEARRRIESGALSAPLWLVAKRQESGKGRRGRAWSSPEGNLYATLVTLAPQSAAQAAQASLVAAVATAQAIDTVSVRRVHPECKWPNDLLISGRKVAGILLETAAAPDGQTWLVIGVGVNIAHAPADNQVRWPATTLNEYLNEPITVEELLVSLGLQFNQCMRVFDTAGFQPIAEAWSSRAALIGTRVCLSDGENKLSAAFTGIDEMGAARIRLDSGHERVVHGGDLEFAPPKAQ